MIGKIFISYRRDDSAGYAGRVHDRLEHEFGRDLVFIDVDAIPLGADFANYLREAVGACDVLLAVIGPKWLDARDKDGRRRLDDSNDYVRVEIAAALQRDIPVIPILVDHAPVPRANELPDDISSLSLRNGLEVHHGSFHADLDRLIKSLRGLVTVTKANAQATETKNSGLGMGLAGTRVLWVDDCPANNVYEQRMLESLGIVFERSLDTGDALEKLSKQDFDLIISDMGRPSGEQAGFDLLSGVRRRGMEIPFIIYSSTNFGEAATKRGAQGSTDSVHELFQLVLSNLAASQVRNARRRVASASGGLGMMDGDREKTRIVMPRREPTRTRMPPAPAVSTQSDRLAGPGGGDTHTSGERPTDPLPPVAGWLVIIRGPGTGQSVAIPSGMNTLGRGEDQRIRVDFGDSQIARSHALLTFDPKTRRFFLSHNTSNPNLTYVRGQVVLASSVELSAGDHIEVGTTTLRFVPLCGPDFSWD
jgi:CheY-like chemotaxis protein